MPVKAGIQKDLKNMDTTKQRRSFSKGLWLFPILLALIVNYNVVQNGYGWDDEDIVPNIQSDSPWWSVFSPAQSDRPSFNDSPPYYRPMVALSYRLDSAIWGRSPFGFHLSVLLAHVLNTLLVYFLALRLLIVSRDSLNANAGRRDNPSVPSGAIHCAPTASCRWSRHPYLRFILFMPRQSHGLRVGMMCFAPPFFFSPSFFMATLNPE